MMWWNRSVGPLTRTEVSQLAAALEVPPLADARTLWVTMDTGMIGDKVYVRAEFSATVKLDLVLDAWGQFGSTGRRFTRRMRPKLEGNKWWDLGPSRPSDLVAYRWQTHDFGRALLRREGDRQILYISRLFTLNAPGTALPPTVKEFLRDGDVPLDPLGSTDWETPYRYWINE